MSASKESQRSERRRSARAALRLPIRIEGYLTSGEKWAVTSTTADASAGGARFALERAVRVGHALLVNLPMPRALRNRDHWDSSYRSWALVRHVERRADQTWDVGVMFYGRNPPRGFHENPGARFLLPRDVASVAPEPIPHSEEVAEAPPEETAGAREAGAGAPDAAEAREPSPAEEPPAPRDPDPGGKRAEERYDIFVNLTLQEMDEFGAVLREEVTVAENLSLNGARVMTSLRFSTGDVLILQEIDGSFACRAEVRHAWVGADRVRRLNLRFLDGRQPTKLLPRS